MRNHMAAGWFYSPSQIAIYLSTRISNLAPPKRRQIDNPFSILAQLSCHQWLMFFVGFLGWTWDAFDFFTVTLTLTEISTEFEVLPSKVSWGITLTLMVRSIGALLFGLLADRYGRKWPYITNLALLVVFELATGFTHSLYSFLAVRALFGICMGGLYGPAVATSLEDLPPSASGVMSGFFQLGYAVGYLLAAVFYRAFVPTTSHGWRSLFWFGAGPPVLIIVFRLLLPETKYSQAVAAEREQRPSLPEGQAHDKSSPSKTDHVTTFARSTAADIANHWVLLVYMIILMAGFTSISHGSSDLYPTFLKSQLRQSATNVTVITVMGQISGIFGCLVIGHGSNVIGRRLAMLIAIILGGALVPAYVLSIGDLRMIAPVFFEQMFVGGVWGPIPIYLIELSPPASRTLIMGLTYQLGNLASSASSTIQAVIGERYPLPPLNGVKRYDYGRVIGIFLGAVWAYSFVFLLLGPEMSDEEREKRAGKEKNVVAEGHEVEDARAGNIRVMEKDAEAVHRHVGAEAQEV